MKTQTFCWKCGKKQEMKSVQTFVRPSGSEVLRGRCVFCSNFITKSKNKIVRGQNKDD